MTPPLDKYDLYELAVQNPVRMRRFLRAVHGRNPRVLREDFSGPGGLCRAWVLEPRSGVRAVAVDRDPEPLAKFADFKRIKRVCADVRRAPDKADVIAALNFPVGYWHTRRDLVKYLRLCRSRLNRRGILAFDMYGGASAFRPMMQRRRVAIPGGGTFEYVWEQRDADPLSARVLNAVHFRAPDAEGRPVWTRDAFVYDWRLWSIPELREAMQDAGFEDPEVYDRMGDALDADGNMYVRPLEPGDPLDRDYVVYVVGRAPAR